MSAKDIAEAYRKRWDIEVFFKFLKQELNFSHFLSTNENGIKVVLYMTLITAMLNMIYKRKKGIKLETRYRKSPQRQYKEKMLLLIFRPPMIANPLERRLVV